MTREDGIYKNLVLAQEIQKATQLEDAVLSGEALDSLLLVRSTDLMQLFLPLVDII